MFIIVKILKTFTISINFQSFKTSWEQAYNPLHPILYTIYRENVTLKHILTDKRTA